MYGVDDVYVVDMYVINNTLQGHILYIYTGTHSEK